MKNTITATFKIVTPMFIGDANQQASTIRPPSVKGALRFWWRALHWDQYSSQFNSEAEALKKLHDKEAQLFGIAGGDEQGGQGVFLLNVINQNVKSIDQPFSNMTPSQLYLLGMGLGTFKGGNKALRSSLKEDGTFQLQLMFRPNCTPEDKKSIADALYAFGLLGALGSRARHGMGSVALCDWLGEETRNIPKTKQEYLNALKQLIGKPSSAHAPFSAFTQKTRIDYSISDKSVFTLLDKLGAEQQMFRSYGRGGKVLNRDAEKNFKGDHDLVFKVATGEIITQAPKRVVFGLPHNYFFSSITAKANVDYAPNGQSGRRASPLLLHIHPLDDMGLVAIHILFESLFLPKGATLRIKSKKISHVSPQVEWQVIHNYLNRYSQKETILG